MRRTEPQREELGAHQWGSVGADPPSASFTGHLAPGNSRACCNCLFPLLQFLEKCWNRSLHKHLEAEAGITDGQGVSAAREGSCLPRDTGDSTRIHPQFLKSSAVGGTHRPENPGTSRSDPQGSANPAPALQSHPSNPPEHCPNAPELLELCPPTLTF